MYGSHCQIWRCFLSTVSTCGKNGYADMSWSAVASSCSQHCKKGVPGGDANAQLPMMYEEAYSLNPWSADIV
eukprot:3212609-Prymnesium_polylepis.1